MAGSVRPIGSHVSNPSVIEFSRRMVLVFRLCTVTSISSTFTSYRQHVAKVGVPARIIASYVVRGTRRHK